jgi:hypothetical protein
MAEAAAVILLVTWIVSGEPPSGYHQHKAEFPSVQACEAAKAEALKDGETVGAWLEQNRPASKLAMLSAVCIEPSRLKRMMD